MSELQRVLADLERATLDLNDLNDSVLIIYDDDYDNDNSELDFAWAANYTFPGQNN